MDTIKKLSLIHILKIHKHLDKKQAREEAIEMLRMVNIPSPEKRIDNYPHEMSGGMRQRVMIAMAVSYTHLVVGACREVVEKSSEDEYH